MHNFWKQLPRPFFVLAPLANVTDAAFRTLIARYSKPHGPQVMYTEFVSADGLMHGNRDVLLRDLQFSDAQRPIVAQLFTSDSGSMEAAAGLAAELGFDGIDINMGCPDRAVERQGAGAALIKNMSQAVKVIEAAQRGAPTLPISVKTRLGYNTDVLESWVETLLSTPIAALTIHARTRKEMSKVPARWERIARAVELRNALRSPVCIIGNGDVVDLADAAQKAAHTGADGVMLGRAIFGTPWLFDPSRQPTLRERLEIAIEHTALFERMLGDLKNFAIMKKHFKAYIEGFPGAKELRMRLMETKQAWEVEEILREYIASI